MTVSPPPTDTDRAAGACRVTAPDLSAAEQAFLARPAVDAAEDARVEVMARAIAASDGVDWDSPITDGVGLLVDYRRNAVAALAALGGAAGETETARAQARLAWNVHAKHVDRMNVLLLQSQAERDEAVAELRALVEAAGRGDHVWPPAYRHAREYVAALARPASPEAGT